mgnify:CR=1 FL=1
MAAVLVRNVLANVFGRGASILAWFLLTPWVLAQLGPERFGFWSLLTTLTTTALIMDLGLGSAVTKYVAEYGGAGRMQEQRGAWTSGAGVALVLAVAWAAALWFGRDLLLDFAHVGGAWRSEARQAAGMMAFAAALGLLSLVPAAALAGVHRLDLANRVALGSALVQVIASILFLRAGAGLPGLMSALLISGAVSCSAGLLVLRHVAPTLVFDPHAASQKRWSEQVRFSAAIQIISLGVLFQFQLPKFAFARWSGLASIGEFELAYRVAFAAWSLPSLLLPPLLPAFAELAAKQDWDAAWSLYRRAGRYLFALAMPLAALIAALSPVFYVAWLGQPHPSASLALSVLAALLGFNVLTSLGCLFGRAIGRPWMEARYQLLALSIHAVLLTALVPRFGFAGGLVAMAVSSVIGTFQYLWVFHRTLSRSGRQFVADFAGVPLLVSVAGGGVAFGVGSWVLSSLGAGRERALLALGAGGLVGTAVIVTGLALFGHLKRDEWMAIVRHLPGRGKPA